ncbi:ribulose 5-phosphate epimerase [Coprothermobacter proteolyticus DSM 5265]|uniref:L-ribulose 5-phosphate 4-epimerase n=1 Tax=Coprothermobacter proteolyticus (strain ATCC 35245 / DSM 5265 / OCM 4 / BT) TaxID=309798 RepID=B5Y6R4_COPPD|nr:class II aldolase/adducin family protein [Coprothermobacter proteolyticus]ACI17127.1 ribulose 5-phosphate epimerase [Coprothermobacter proteolyticus DSM 5265]
MNHREQLARQTLADVMKKLYSRGLISVYGGNASMVLSDDNALLITPSGFNKESLKEEDLVKVDFASGKVLGEGKPSSELRTHLAIYGANKEAKAVVHAHPTTLVGVCTAGYDFGVYTPEQALLVGKPMVINFCMGEELAERMSALAGTCQAVVVKNHGVFAWGPTIMEAYAKIEILEEAAKMVVAGNVIMGGLGVSSISDEQVLDILKNYRPSHKSQ